MNRTLATFLGLSLLMPGTAFAETMVKTEPLNPAEIEGPTVATLANAGAAAVVKPAKIEHLWVVFKTHLDIGYTDRIEDVLKKYRVNMMDGALKVVEASRDLPPEKRFSWTLAGWPLTHVLGPRQDPARRARIEQAVREGAIAFHALPFTTHTETQDLEDLVRGLGFSTRLSRQYHRPLPIGAKMTDVPCHSWVLPTLLAHAGAKFLQIGCNDTSAYVRVPHLFWWEGPDGSRILCNYTRVYGSGLTPPPDWPSKHYLAMTMTYDNVGPPSAAEVESLRQRAEKSLPGVQVHFGTLDDFAQAVITENPELPVVRADMPDTWIHGWLSMPLEAKAARHFRALEPALDTLDTQLRAWGLTTNPLAPALAEAYEQSGLFSEHTFGPWGPNGGSWNSGTPRYLYGLAWKTAYARGAYRKYEEAFDDKRAFAHRADEIVHRELSLRLELLARSVNAAGQRLVVYNALPWERSGVVEVPGQPGQFIFAEDLPANGYRTYPMASSDAMAKPEPSAPTTLDTPFYRVAFDLHRGGLASLVDRETGRELVDKSSPYALGQFLHERFDQARMLAFHNAYGRPGYSWPKGDLPKDAAYAALTPPAWSLAVQHTAVADIATLTAKDTLGLAKGIALVITFYRRQPSVDVEWRTTDKTPDPMPEGGWLCFPFAVTQPQFLLGRLGGPIDPAKDIVVGANRHYFCLHTGLIITGPDGAGVGLCPLDSPGVSLGEPGLWKFSLDYTPKQPTVFVNLYNNKWNTNFPEWQGGSWTSRVRLWPTGKNSDTAKTLIIPSWEARLPLLAAAADGPAGQLPSTQAGMSVSRAGVLVTAFGPNPDGPGTLLRVWDQTGVTGELTVTLPGNFTTATRVNLRGEEISKPVPIHAGKLAFQLGAYAPASFLLEPSRVASTGGGSAARPVPEGIAIRQNASALESLAANEIRRYVYLRTGKLMPVQNAAIGGNRIVVACQNPSLGGDLGQGLGPQQFRLKSDTAGGEAIWWIVGGDEVGTLYGAYRFAEKLGVRFGLDEEALPDEPLTGAWPEMNETGKPRFALRGLQPFHDFSVGPDWWNLHDYQTVLSQMAKLRMNFIGFHTYPSWNPATGPEANVWIGLPEDVDDQGNVRFGYEAGVVTTRRGWAVTPFPTSQYASGAGLLFENDDYAPDFMLECLDWPQSGEAGAALFNRYGDFQKEVFAQAQRLGIKTCVGTELPLGVPKALASRLETRGMKPEDPKVLRRLYEGTFLRLIRKMPIDYYWLWTPEVWLGMEPGCPGWEMTTRANVERDLGLAEAAAQSVQAPFGLATCGWRLGTRDDAFWMDKRVPRSWPASSINTEAGRAPVEPHYGAMGERPKWVIGWAEDDDTAGAHCCTCWDLQLWVERMLINSSDAFRYGCEGLMAIHWRTAAISPNITALTRAAWDFDGADGTPATVGAVAGRRPGMEAYWTDWGRGLFGGEAGAKAGRILQKFDGGHLRINALVAAGAKTTDASMAEFFAPLREMEWVRSSIKGIGNLERFDYWLNLVRATHQRVRTWVLAARLSSKMNEVDAILDADNKARFVRKEVLPLRVDLARNYEDLIMALVNGAKSPGEIGTIASIESGSRGRIVSAHDAAIARILGEPLPAEAAVRTTYRGEARIFVSAKGTQMKAGEPREIRAFVLAGPKSTGVNLYWRSLGDGAFNKVVATHRARQAYRVTLPAQSQGAVEYYLEAMLDDGQRLRWPAKALSINQTMVVW